MNSLYPVAVDALLGGYLDLLHDTLRVGACQDAPFDGAHLDVADLDPWWLSDVPPVALVDRSVAGGYLLADDLVLTYGPGAVGRDITALILHRADGLLVAFLDTRPDLMAFTVHLPGGPVGFAWRDGQVMGL